MFFLCFAFLRIWSSKLKSSRFDYFGIYGAFVFPISMLVCDIILRSLMIEKSKNTFRRGLLNGPPFC